MVITLWIALFIVWLVYGAPFLQAVGHGITQGIPQALNAIAADRYFRRFKKGIVWGVSLPIGGLLLASWLAQTSTGWGQAVIYGTFGLSFLILKIAASLINAFASIGLNLLPVGERTQEAAQEIREGMYILIDKTLAFELFVGLSYLCLGIFADPAIAAIVMFGVGTYYQVSAAYNVPVTWAPKFMMNVALAEAILLTVVTGLSVFPPTREYVDRVGLDPLDFLSAGMINLSTLDAARQEARDKHDEICNAKIRLFQDRIKAIRVTRIPDPKDSTKEIINPQAETDYAALSRALEAERKKCFVRQKT